MLRSAWKESLIKIMFTVFCLSAVRFFSSAPKLKGSLSNFDRRQKCNSCFLFVCSKRYDFFVLFSVGRKHGMNRITCYKLRSNVQTCSNIMTRPKSGTERRQSISLVSWWHRIDIVMSQHAYSEIYSFFFGVFSHWLWHTGRVLRYNRWRCVFHK